MLKISENKPAMIAADQNAPEAYSLSVCPAWHGWPKQVAALVESATALGGLEEATAALEADEQLRVLLIYERAATCALVMSRETGTPIDQCLDEWMRDANALSDLLAKHRRRIVLVDARQACLNARKLCGRIDLDAGVRDALENTHVTPLDRVAVTLAEACLQRFPAASLLDGWLRASALDLSNEHEDHRASAVAAAARYAELDTELDRLRGMLFDLEQERETLAEQARIEATECDRAVAEARERCEHLALTLREREREAYRMRSKLDWLRGQRKTRDKTIESLRADIDRLATENRDVDARRAEAEDWLQGIMVSRSYRIMTPLRKIRAMMRPRS